MPLPGAHDRLPRQGIFLLIALSLFWGLNWPIMKMVLTEVPPLYFRSGCLLLGGVGLLLLTLASGNSIRVPSGHWRRLIILSIFNIIGWNVFAIYGVSLLPSGRAALLGYTMPLWSTLLSVWLLGERITFRRILGLVLGLAGILALMGGTLESLSETPVGFACMILAAWSWALGIVIFKRQPVPMPTIALTGWTMLLGSLPILLFAVPLETSRLIMPSFWPLFGLAYNIFFAFMFCYWAWNRIVLMVPVGVSSLSSLATPLVGVLSGIIFLGEPLGWQEIIAAALILAAVGTVSLKR
jgi:drug/metabolite transporter (DMT)-like permease